MEPRALIGTTSFALKNTPQLVSAPTIKLQANHLNFHYGRVHVLKDVSLPLYANRVTALIGPSGCGKSTLLRIFNRIYELYPSQHVQGEVLVDGENILSSKIDLNMLRSRIGMVFQRPTPFPMSVFNNVAFALELRSGLRGKQLAEKVEQALLKAGLWAEVKDKLGESGLSLSGGQQQRLCIARTIAAEPDIILLDEPCSALDPISTANIEQTLGELKRHHTIAIVTHNLEQAARVSDYAGFMYLGELVEFEATERLFTQPKNEQTQNYVTGRFG